jgi:hypothetical protein
MFEKMTTLFIIVLFISISLPLKQADAMPAFARKYRFSCNTCHVAAPKLKDYGDDFAGNGFKIPDGEEPRRAYIDTGDETLLLMRELPLAVRFDAYVQAADRAYAKSDFQSPYGIKLLSGGPISKHISYYFYFYVYERGEVAGVEDAVIVFNDIGNTSFDLAVGQFQVSDPLFKRELRLTFEDYMLYKMKPEKSIADLTYDRGLMASYGFNFGLDLIAMAVNGNGIGESINRIFDVDNDKGFALRAIQGLGFLNIGAFAYTGREAISDTLDDNNKIMTIGPDVSIGNDNWELNAQYLLRQDDFNVSGKQDLHGSMVELAYFPKGDQSKFIYTLLYNRIDDSKEFQDYETATFSVSHMAARNIRLLGEFTYDIINEKARFAAGVVAAF